MLKNKNYQKLFPNYIISKEEQDWCLNYEQHFDTEPIYTENVFSPKDFLKMCRESVSWAEECFKDMQHNVEGKMINLSYYNEVAFS
ncbi:MAG: hypothetical protein KBC56_04920 [Flavobacterium sp.]|nr:hypothetical protein [Flavobacterium sp.]